MTFFEFEDDVKLQKASDNYVKAYGGEFYCEEPGVALCYESKDRKESYYSPHEATSQQIYEMLTNGKPISEQWPPIEYDPECDY